MAGGLILIVVLVSLIPVPTAMILHGIVQGVANGSRFWFLRRHTAWRILPLYLLGVGFTATFFAVTAIVADAAVVLIVAGSLPWVSQLTPPRFRLNITRPLTAFVGGVVTTAAQLISGASGPILDAFYQRADLNRLEIVATKAITAAVGHVVKIFYFVLISATVTEDSHVLLSWWFILVAVALAIAGTRLGTRILEKTSEERFRLWTNRLILFFGTCVVIGGVFDLATR